MSSDEVMGCLTREYLSFFAPLEPEFYEPDVSFDDPLSSLAGLDAYKGNVDMLAGRTALGQFLFADAGIALHSVERLSELALRTRWTLRVTFRPLPWLATAKFSGVSEYALDATTGRVAAQTDYWDSIDLRPGGRYQRSSVLEGLRDFAAELAPRAAASPEEAPFELLRRAADYEVRRYSAADYARCAGPLQGSAPAKRRAKRDSVTVAVLPRAAAAETPARCAAKLEGLLMRAGLERATAALGFSLNTRADAPNEIWIELKTPSLWDPEV